MGWGDLNFFFYFEWLKNSLYVPPKSTKNECVIVTFTGENKNLHA